MAYSPPLPLERLLAGLLAVADLRRRSPEPWPLDAALNVDPNIALTNLPPQNEGDHVEAARLIIAGLAKSGLTIEDHHGRTHERRPSRNNGSAQPRGI